MQKDNERAAEEGSEGSSRPVRDGAGQAAKPIGIVDDDDAMCDSLAVLLEANGFEVFALASGTALLTDERRRSMGFLVIDQHMPVMDGLAVIAALRSESLLPPTVLITGRLDPGIAERAGALGVTILEKPFPAARLIGLIRDGLV